MTKLRLEGVLTEQEEEKIHLAAVSLLKRLGFLCNHREILEVYRQAGCIVGDELPKPKGVRVVKFTEEIIADALNKAPSQFTVYPVAPGYSELKLGSEEIYFGNTGGDKLWDLETGELRYADLSDFVTGSRLCDACENFDTIMGYPLYWMYDVATKDQYERYGLVAALMNAIPMLHCGKPQHRVYFAANEQEFNYMLDLWSISAGGKDAFRKKPCGILLQAFVSPLSLIGRTEPEEPLGWADWTWLSANAGIPFGTTPNGLMSGGSPATVAGTIVQSVAEFLAILVAIQAINPGNPVALGDYTGSLDIRTGSKAPFRPESLLVHVGLSTMAQYYNKPSTWVPSSVDAPVADAQAAWERAQAYLTAALVGAHFVTSGGNVGMAKRFDYRQLLIDNEIIGMVRHFVKGINTSDKAIPLDLMVETGFGALGNTFFSAEHTRTSYRTEMWR